MVLCLLLSCALCISLVTDLCFRKIYDRVTLPTIFLSWVIQGMQWGWVEGFFSGFLGCCIGAGFLGIFALWNKGFGWGDVKLMGAVGAALGWPRIMEALVLVSLIGALQAFISVVVRNIRRHGFTHSPSELAPKKDRVRERASIPYGVSIALGGLGSLVLSFWIG